MRRHIDDDETVRASGAEGVDRPGGDEDAGASRHRARRAADPHREPPFDRQHSLVVWMGVASHLATIGAQLEGRMRQRDWHCQNSTPIGRRVNPGGA